MSYIQENKIINFTSAYYERSTFVMSSAYYEKKELCEMGRPCQLLNDFG